MRDLKKITLSLIKTFPFVSINHQILENLDMWYFNNYKMLYYSNKNLYINTYWNFSINWCYIIYYLDDCYNTLINNF